MKAKAEQVRISVVVPSYGRPADLAGCMASLAAQSRSADEVVVVLRDDDEPSHRALPTDAPGLPIRVVAPQAPGFMPALRAGLVAATGDVVAITDDDARPRPGWLGRIEAVFTDGPDVVAVGGPDVRPQSPTAYPRGGEVGSISWLGRLVGRHEEEWPTARDVLHLRGANMAFRAPCPLPDPALRGDGTAMEADMCLSAGRRGRVRFDPAVVVDHLVSDRPGGQDLARSVADLDGAAARGFNVALVLAKHTPARGQRAGRLAFLLLAGQRTAPGAVRVLRGHHPGPSRSGALRALTTAKLGGWRAGRSADRTTHPRR